jgi:hypothetical protein
LDVSQEGIIVSGDDDVGGLDGSLENLESLLFLQLKLKQDTIHLVDHKDWLDSLSESLTEDGLGLDANSLNAIDDDDGSVSNTESGSNLRGEINMSGGIDQVDQEWLSLSFAGLHLVEHRDSSGLDGNATFLLILTGVSEASLSSLLGRDNSGLADKRVSEGGLSVIDVSDDTHVTDVVSLVHNLTDLLSGKVDHFDRFSLGFSLG